MADLSLQAQVRGLQPKLAPSAAHGRPALDGLINNAGTFTYWLALTPEGFEPSGRSSLAPFLQTHGLLPCLLAAPSARWLRSAASRIRAGLNWDDLQLRRRYNGLHAYEKTKLANVLFTRELNRRLGTGSSVRAFAADPGLVDPISASRAPRPGALDLGTPPVGRGPPEPAARGIVSLLTDPSIQESPSLERCPQSLPTARPRIRSPPGPFGNFRRSCAEWALKKFSD